MSGKINLKIHFFAALFLLMVVYTAIGQIIYLDADPARVDKGAPTLHDSNAGQFYYTLPSGLIAWQSFFLGWSSLETSTLFVIEVSLTNIGTYDLKNVCFAQQFVFKCEPMGLGPAYHYKNAHHAWYRYPSDPEDEWWVRSHGVMGQNILISMDRSVTDLPLSIQKDGHVANLLETDEVTLIPFGDLVVGERATKYVYFMTGAGGVCWRGHLISTTPEPTTPVRLEIVGSHRVVEKSTARYKSVVYDDNGTGRNVTDSTVWFVEPNTYASIDASGVLYTDNIHTTQYVTIYAQYTEDNVTFDAQRIVQISFPQTFHVPAEYRTIQSALHAAVGGDTVLVADGLYTGDGNRDLDFNGKAITLHSENGPETCIIDCNGTEDDPHRGFYFHSGEDANSVLEGFTINNGYSEPSWPGGAINCHYSSPSISNCIISNNFSGYSAGAMYNNLSSPTLTNCTFTGNSVGWHGGGMYNCNESSPTLANCKFLENSAEEPWWSCGGGMFNRSNSNPTLSNCTFSGNSSNYEGGGMYNDESSPVLSNCTFSRNTSENYAGAMYNLLSSPMMTSCTFTSNSTQYDGGAMANFYFCKPKLNNCIFSGNSSCRNGGGMDNYKSSPTVTNCTFSGNSASWDGGAISNSHSSPRLANCMFSGNLARRGGGIYNDGSSLELMSSTFVGNLATFGNALACNSWLQLYPSNLQITSSILWVWYGKPPLPPPPPPPAGRMIDSIFAGLSNEIYITDNSTITITYSDVHDGWPGEGNIDADPCFVDPGYWDAGVVWIDGDYHLLADSPCINTGDTNHPYDPNETDLDGRPRVIGGRIDMGAYELQPPSPRVLYVDDAAAGANDGSSWANAYNYLQDALATAYSGDEIRVAQGTYKPDQGAGITPSDREATFQLINGVTIKGGHAGYNEPDPNAWDVELYKTILSGDVGIPDANSDNSYHVLVGADGAIVDGLTIIGGNADGYLWRGYGGGMLNYESSPTIRRCIFRNNYAKYGGGMSNWYEDAKPTVTMCVFRDNEASEYGGAMDNTWASPNISNCFFVRNEAKCGGGISNHESYSLPTIANSIFCENTAIQYGGGMYFDWCSGTVTNCTFGNNAANCGNSVSNAFAANPRYSNCIMWNDSEEGDEVDNYLSWLAIIFCDIRGGYPGEGNIDQDPCFAELGYWDVNVMPDGDTYHYWVEGDYHLLEDSPCIDAGDPNYVAEPNETDLDGRPRVIGGRIDMGAYEYSPPVPAEVRIVPRTINLASKGNWITCYIWLPEGYDVADIDANSVLLEDEIGVESIQVYEEKQIAMVRFSREQAQAILNIGEAKLAITGQLSDGTVFEAKDVIIVINKGSRKSAK